MRSWFKRGAISLYNATVFQLIGLWPRSRRHWVFGEDSGQFAGNAKYLFLWLSIHRPEIHVSWITKQRSTQRLLEANGYRAHLFWTVAGCLSVMRAKVLVSGHCRAAVHSRMSNGAFFVNLWHGIGLKAVGYAFRGAGRGRFDWGETAAPPDVFVTTSDFTQQHFSSQYRYPKEICPQLGYPRLDCAFDPALAALCRKIDRSAGFEFNQDGFAEVYIYLPTFRDSKRPFWDQALPDLGALSEALAARNAVFYVKPHPNTPIGSLSEFDNIRLWPNEVDFNTYLPDFTGLITDYSSVLYDYLLVRDRGAILYVFDMDEYLSKDRNLSYPFDENIAGLRVDSFGDLCRALREGDALTADHEADVLRIREKFWGGSARPASPAILAYVEERLDREWDGLAID